MRSRCARHLLLFLRRNSASGAEERLPVSSLWAFSKLRRMCWIMWPGGQSDIMRYAPDFVYGESCVSDVSALGPQWASPTVWTMWNP